MQKLYLLNSTYKVKQEQISVIFHTIHEGIVALSAAVGVSELAACNFGPQKEQNESRSVIKNLCRFY